MTHDIELEKRMVCLAHSNNKGHSSLRGEAFYSEPLGKMYDAIKGGASLNTDTDFKEHNIDGALLYECLMLNAFSDVEMGPTANKIAGLYNKRVKIKKAQEALKEAENAPIETEGNQQEGFEELISEQADISGGTFKLLPTPWPKLTQDSRFTEGKAITIICGDPGVGKSFFVTQLFLCFAMEGVKAIIWGAEDNPRFHARRAIAQYIGNGNLCDYEWLKANNKTVMELYVQNRAMIDTLMESMYTSNNVTREELKRWCKEKAMEGYEVVGIDPITFFSGDSKAHVADQEILEHLNQLRKQYGTRFIIVTHPRESSGSVVSQDGVAGGRAVSRFAQIMLWITEAEGEGNRKVYTLKTRNGKRDNGGRTIFNFSRDTARFEEI